PLQGELKHTSLGCFFKIKERVVFFEKPSQKISTLALFNRILDLKNSAHFLVLTKLKTKK
ncbi:hypothetical protein, partial [Bacillus sp. GC_Bacil_1]|uniref:hypothetical protein n=1 Tax=Bacillus sp. GC_Bacil_1 TaxID=2937370 RepID=UPI00226B1C43